MAVRKTLQIGDERLKAVNKTVRDVFSKKTKQVIHDLKDTMQKNGLVGMAAPQIAENYKIFVTEPRKTKTRIGKNTDIFRVYINPKIVVTSKKKSVITEGCGSVFRGELFAPVKRPTEITLEALDEKGKKFRFTCNGLLARVILHEYDHLNGVEFTQKILDYSKITDREHYLKLVKSGKLKEPLEISKKEVKYIL